VALRPRRTIAVRVAVAAGGSVISGLVAITAPAEARTTHCSNIEVQGQTYNEPGLGPVASSDSVRQIQTHDMAQAFRGHGRCQVADALARKVVYGSLSHGGVPRSAQFPKGVVWTVKVISADNTLRLGIVRRGRDSVTFRF